jgi:hypothetical protein
MTARPTRRLRPSIAIAVAIAAVAGASDADLAPTSAARPISSPASTRITLLSNRGTTVIVAGRVKLPRNTRRERSRTRVMLTLAGSGTTPEQSAARINRRLQFRSSWTTTLTGSLKFTAQLTIGGRDEGKAVTRTITIANPNAPQQLIGKFEVQAGSAPAGAAPTGSYFEMLQPSGSPLANLSSPAPNKNYTPLSAGSDGGLETYAYQPPPAPAFKSGKTGGALASRIIAPVPFYGVDFSVVTDATDPQLGSQDQLPAITAQDGTLTGQLSAWVAQWNGQSFNQGTPKPDGSLPAPTTALTGTYNPTTRAFTLTWKSRIVGGPFNGFCGVWRLAGTFVPGS